MEKGSVILNLLKNFEKSMQQTILDLGDKTELRDACGYALCSGGKRIRPLITLLIGKALGYQELVLPAAEAIELFHTSSLILDDLPCMDNEKMRRNKPTLHCVYGEGTALLASYTLVAAAYEKIALSSQCAKLKFPKKDFCEKALLMVSRLAGLRGATQGQYYDLHPPEKSEKIILKIMFYKTVTLFELAFCFGWLFAGGDAEKLQQVVQASHHFGYAFQISDDLTDSKEDAKDNAKLNIALELGIDKTKQLLFEKITDCRKILESLGLFSKDFQILLDSINSTSAILH